MIDKRALLCILVTGIMAFARAAPAIAQNYPDRPIKMIVGVAAGGPQDTMARIVAQEMHAKLGQPVVVENRTGAGTTIGAKAVLTAEPDGYTLFWGTLSTMAIAPVLYKDQNFDPSSLVPVAMVAEFPSVMVVGQNLPVKTFAEFVAYAKANRGKVNYGGSLGSPPMLMGMKLNNLADLGMTFVPYRGSAPAISDLLAGRLEMQFEALMLLVPLIQEGKLKALVVEGNQRARELPEVPTLREAGVGDFPGTGWAGILAPPGTPQPIVSKLNTTINEILGSAEVKANMAKFYVTLRPGTPQQFADVIRSEGPKWAQLARESGATAQ